MISHIRGTIIHLDLKYIILDVQDVGYKIFVSTSTLEHLAGQKSPISLFTYLSVREDALDLYGFNTKDDQEFFELLLTISGIGPKSAMSILSTTTVDTMKEAIYNDDPSYLVKVGGLGRKNAEKIVRELKDKILDLRNQSDEAGVGRSNRTESTMAIEALMALGFSGETAREAVKKIDKKLSTSEQVKLALKHLQ